MPELDDHFKAYLDKYRGDFFHLYGRYPYQAEEDLLLEMWKESIIELLFERSA